MALEAVGSNPIILPERRYASIAFFYLRFWDLRFTILLDVMGTGTQWHTDFNGLDTDFAHRDGHRDAMAHGF